ncbi:MAG: hypothetical protein AAGA31_11980, partial [Bacteroidota bacterium]
KKLPELLATVVEHSRDILQRREREWERNRKNQLQLQRSIAALRALDFPGKVELLNSLQEVSDHLP